MSASRDWLGACRIFTTAESVALSVAIRADDGPLTLEFARRAQDIVRQEHLGTVEPPG